jgi:phosphate starvation-inducible PhoH-like protein
MALSRESKERIKKNGKKKMSNYEIQEAYDEAKVAREFSRFKPVKLSKKQQELHEGIQKSVITTITGPPGTAKTFSACYAAVEALKKGDIKKIYLVKPLETSGEEMGFLPGDMDDKVAPFVASFLDNFNEMMEQGDIKAAMSSKVIEFVPIAFMRGRTLKDCYIIADELQNCDVKQLMTLITRMGKNTKTLLIGDQNQNDINKRYVAFDFFVEKILGEDPSIFHYKFGRADIVRHPLLIKIVDNYEKAQMEGLLPDTKNKN